MPNYRSILSWFQNCFPKFSVRTKSLIGFGIGTIVVLTILGLVLSNDPIQINKPGSEIPAIKILVKDEGVYRLTAKQLREYGFSIKESENWALVYRGIEIPFWLIGDGDTAKLIFYVPRTKSLYSTNTILILYKGKGLIPAADVNVNQSLWRIKSQAENIFKQLSENSIIGVRVFEEDNLYQPQAIEEHWFWGNVVSPGQKKYKFNLSGVASGSGLIRIRLWSNTEAEANPDHAFQIIINGSKLSEEQWDGKGEHLIEIQVPDGILRNGENEISFEGVRLPGVSIDLNYLDWVELFYSRQPQADHGELTFISFHGDPPIAGLLPPKWMIDTTNPLSPTLISKDVSGDKFQDGHLYYAVDERGLKAVNEIQPLKLIPISQMESHPNADYLVIGHSALFPALQPLLQWRRSEGLKVSTQDVSEIYDRYYGYPEPQAIQKFLNYVADNNPNLKYVLLVGDFTYDAKMKNEADLTNVPTFYLQTMFGGQTSSELPFSLSTENYVDYINNTNNLEVRFAVGRIPASQPKQIENWVKKLLEVERGEKTSNPRKIVAIADPNGDTFPIDASNFLDGWSDTFDKEVYAPPAGSPEATNIIQKYFQDKVFLLSYFGHGSIDMWGKDKMFTINEAKALSGQATYPIVMQMTCLTGYYIHPENESLTEALLWNPSGGAVMVIAPSSLTLPNDQGFFTRAWINAFEMSGEDDRIGDIWKQSLNDVALTSQGVRDVIATYTLFGDPAMKIP